MSMRLLVRAITKQRVQLEWDFESVESLPRSWFPYDLEVDDVLEVIADGQGLVRFSKLERESEGGMPP